MPNPYRHAGYREKSASRFDVEESVVHGLLLVVGLVGVACGLLFDRVVEPALGALLVLAVLRSTLRLLGVF